ncbi:MAG: hypothetical protein KDB27_16775 [Planctomycetales bacterium]|nr:hypothetical protein [Planctomycetales bacterium]
MAGSQFLLRGWAHSCLNEHPEVGPGGSLTLDPSHPSVGSRKVFTGKTMADENDPVEDDPILRRFMVRVASAWKLKDYRAACDRIDTLMSESIPEGLSSESLLEVQRLAARMAFAAASDYGAPFEFLRQRFEACCNLRFADGPLGALSVYTEYATACARRREVRASKQALCEARKLLGQLPSSFHEARDTYRRIIELCEQELARDG